MKLVATLRGPKDSADRQKVAAACGLTLAEANMRLAAEPPALLAKLADEAADQLVKDIRVLGLPALACPLPPPDDKARVVVRTFELGDGGATFTPRAEPALTMDWERIVLILRGTRSVRSRTERSEQVRKFSIGTAVATAGMKVSSTTRQTSVSEHEDTEQFVFVYDDSGRCAAIYESLAVFTCLGAAMQASRTANMMTVARMMRERAKKALYDERLVRMGRRTLPFVLAIESHSSGTNVSQSTTDTATTVDVLAEILRRGAAEGLLP